MRRTGGSCVVLLPLLACWMVSTAAVGDDRPTLEFEWQDIDWGVPVLGTTRDVRTNWPATNLVQKDGAVTIGLNRTVSAVLSMQEIVYQGLVPVNITVVPPADRPANLRTMVTLQQNFTVANYMFARGGGSTNRTLTPGSAPVPLAAALVIPESSDEFEAAAQADITSGVKFGALANVSIPFNATFVVRLCEPYDPESLQPRCPGGGGTPVNVVLVEMERLLSTAGAFNGTLEPISRDGEDKPTAEAYLIRVAGGLLLNNVPYNGAAFMHLAPQVSTSAKLAATKPGAAPAPSSAPTSVLLSADDTEGGLFSSRAVRASLGAAPPAEPPANTTLEPSVLTGLFDPSLINLDAADAPIANHNDRAPALAPGPSQGTEQEAEGEGGEPALAPAPATGDDEVELPDTTVVAVTTLDEDAPSSAPQVAVRLPPASAPSAQDDDERQVGPGIVGPSPPPAKPLPSPRPLPSPSAAQQQGQGGSPSDAPSTGPEGVPVRAPVPTPGPGRAPNGVSNGSSAPAPAPAVADRGAEGPSSTAASGGDTAAGNSSTSGTDVASTSGSSSGSKGDDDEDGGGLGMGAILGIAVGAGAALLLLVVLCSCCIARRHMKNKGLHMKSGPDSFARDGAGGAGMSADVTAVKRYKTMTLSSDVSSEGGTPIKAAAVAQVGDRCDEVTMQRQSPVPVLMMKGAPSSGSSASMAGAVLKGMPQTTSWTEGNLSRSADDMGSRNGSGSGSNSPDQKVWGSPLDSVVMQSGERTPISGERTPISGERTPIVRQDSGELVTPNRRVWSRQDTINGHVSLGSAGSSSAYCSAQAGDSATFLSGFQGAGAAPGSGQGLQADQGRVGAAQVTPRGGVVIEEPLRFIDPISSYLDMNIDPGKSTLTDD